MDLANLFELPKDLIGCLSCPVLYCRQEVITNQSPATFFNPQPILGIRIHGDRCIGVGRAETRRQTDKPASFIRPSTILDGAAREGAIP